MVLYINSSIACNHVDICMFISKKHNILDLFSTHINTSPLVWCHHNLSAFQRIDGTLTTYEASTASPLIKPDELVRRLDSVEITVIKFISKWMMDPWKMMDFFQFLLDVGCEALRSNVKDKGTYEKNKNQKTCHLWHVSCYTFERHLSARAADWSRDDFTHFLGPLKGCQLTKGGNATRGTFLFQIEVK